MPQVLVLQEAAEEVLLPRREPPPEIFEAKVDIFLTTSALLHFGQLTWLTALALNTSSSKDSPHWWHTNS
jgi:hypothetical protein